MHTNDFNSAHRCLLQSKSIIKVSMDAYALTLQDDVFNLLGVLHEKVSDALGSFDKIEKHNKPSRAAGASYQGYETPSDMEASLVDKVREIYKEGGTIRKAQAWGIISEIYDGMKQGILKPL
ncbi:MAG: hypothetical protein M0Z71_04715 [Nitrospiraceae bacterium]|nr:hypothetical protein [Nitrospiraceae bacterium]